MDKFERAIARHKENKLFSDKILALSARDVEGGYIVDFETKAELFAYCIASEMTVDKKGGVVVVSGFNSQDNNLLEDAIKAVSCGKWNYILCRDDGTEEIYGN